MRSVCIVFVFLNEKIFLDQIFLDANNNHLRSPYLKLEQMVEIKLSSSLFDKYLAMSAIGECFCFSFDNTLTLCTESCSYRILKFDK